MENPQLIRRTQSPFVASGAGQVADHHDHHHQHFGHAVHTHLSAGLRPQAAAMVASSPQSHHGHGHKHDQDAGVLGAASNDPIPFSSATSVGQSHHHGMQGTTTVATESQQHHSHHHHHQHQTESFGFSQNVNNFAPQQHYHSHDHHHGHDHHGQDAGHEHNHSHHHHHFQQDHGFGHSHAQSHSHNHDHAHGHSHHHQHSHDHHHDHHHDHDHHHHHHHHVSAPSHLPSYSAIFGNLMPRQKTMFTWTVLHAVVATFTWLSGLSSGSLAITGLGYMLMFDTFGILNIFVSSVIHTDSRFQKSTVRYPFGVQRIEVLFGLSNAIFLLFIGMNMLKESLEHLMLEGEHHGGDHHGRIPLFWTIIGLGATLVGSIGYQNHEQFCRLLQANNGSGSSTWSSAAGYNQRSLPVTRNQFSLATLACAAGVVVVWLLPAADSLDKLVAIGQSIVMFALGGPLTKVLGMILLQTTPPMTLESVEDAVRQLAATDGSILGLERAHVWANTYNQLVGTVVVRIAKEADEAVALKTIQRRLFSVLDVDPHALGAGELTVQVVRG